MQPGPDSVVQRQAACMSNALFKPSSYRSAIYSITRLPSDAAVDS